MNPSDRPDLPDQETRSFDGAGPEAGVPFDHALGFDDYWRAHLQVASLKRMHGNTRAGRAHLQVANLDAGWRTWMREPTCCLPGRRPFIALRSARSMNG